MEETFVEDIKQNKRSIPNSNSNHRMMDSSNSVQCDEATQEHYGSRCHGWVHVVILHCANYVCSQIHREGNAVRFFSLWHLWLRPPTTGLGQSLTADLLSNQCCWSPSQQSSERVAPPGYMHLRMALEVPEIVQNLHSTDDDHHPTTLERRVRRRPTLSSNACHANIRVTGADDMRKDIRKHQDTSPLICTTRQHGRGSYGV